MSNIWFTADTHFGHSNIIRYCNRPFSSHEEMDEELLRRFNEVIRPGDILYHLGDVSWSTYDLSKFFDRLKTKEVHLIYGNHDTKATKHQNIRSYNDIKTLNKGGSHITMFHYPMRTWSTRGHGGFQLYGHVHGKMDGIGRQMDVGVDTNNFYPYELTQIQEKLNGIPFNIKE